MAYACPNIDCPHAGVTYKSAEAEALSMKHSSYSYDVLCLVGELRFKQHRTCKEIADTLNERGIVTSERYAQTLYERYQTLLAASLDDYVKQILAETTAQNGGIILSMDGVQPEKGNEMLYVIREVFSGTILAAQNMKSGAAAELRTLIDPIIELGYPIVGIVSDGQVSIRQAFESLLPDVPYQYCQYHYLKDIAKPVVDADRKLKMELKKEHARPAGYRAKNRASREKSNHGSTGKRKSESPCIERCTRSALVQGGPGGKGLCRCSARFTPGRWRTTT